MVAVTSIPTLKTAAAACRPAFREKRVPGQSVDALRGKPCAAAAAATCPRTTTTVDSAAKRAAWAAVERGLASATPFHPQSPSARARQPAWTSPRTRRIAGAAKLRARSSTRVAPEGRALARPPPQTFAPRAPPARVSTSRRTSTTAALAPHNAPPSTTARRASVCVRARCAAAHVSTSPVMPTTVEHAERAARRGRPAAMEPARRRPPPRAAR